MSQKNGMVESTKKPAKFFSLFKPEPDAFRPTKESIIEVGLLIHTEEEVQDTLCGIGSFKAKWLQTLARKEVFLVVYCLVALAQGMFFTYTVSIISTLEKRFKMTSKQTGMVLCGNDISQVILAMVLGYYGNYGHRPRWMSLGVLCAAVSCFIAAVPHFVYGPGQDAIGIVQSLSGTLMTETEGNLTEAGQRKKVELCYTGTEGVCHNGTEGGGESFVGPIVLFFVSQFFVGISTSVFWSIGLPYLDDNVSKKSYPLYYSATLLLRILGPVLGYLVGGKSLSLWIDPTHKPNLTQRDPRWLGAWWLGYIFIGTGLTCVGSLLFLFPRNLPGTLRREAKKVVRQASRDQSRLGGQDRDLKYFATLAKTKKMQAERPNLKNLWAALKRLFTNKVWVGNLFGTVITILAFSGYWNFKPKYLENQFRKSAAEANYYTGMASFTSVVLGTGIGGFILRWVRPRPQYVAAYSIFVTLFLAAGFLALMFIGCPKLHVIGPVDGSSIPPCSSECGCSERYSPICSQDQTTLYYSSCYAGCTLVNATVSPVMYSGCQCIGDNSSILTTSVPFFSTLNISTTQQVREGIPQVTGGWGTSGYCPEPCDTFFYYLIAQIIIKTISSTGRVGSSVIHLRSVRDEDKGLALGTVTVFISLFAFIPAPIIMGTIIDSSCLVWDKSCGITGNCWLYDSEKFRTIIHLVPAVLVFISVLGDIVVYYYSEHLDLYGDKEEVVELEKTTEAKTEEDKPLKSHEDEEE